MNCQAFEGLIDDLASGHSGPGTDSTDAQAHAQSCPRCAARLAGERALASIFREAAAEAVEAPGHLETILLEAFRDRYREPVQETAVRPALRIAPAAWWGIAAVFAIVLVGLGTFGILRSPRRAVVPVTSLPTGNTLPGEVRSAESPAPVRIQASPGAPVVPAAVSPRAGVPSPVPAGNGSPAEIATDFYALTTDSGLATMDSGQLVRVLLPRSVMATYGLPVNQEIADTPVTAQVLIGQDGVARAIRFLSNSNRPFLKTGMQTQR